jgi:Flp pilus assembly pilin Flp
MDSFGETRLIGSRERRKIRPTLGGKQTMKKLILKLRTLTSTSGQDLIEYALMAGFVAVAAGAMMPGVSSSISTIFSKVGSVLKVASTQGS